MSSAPVEHSVQALLDRADAYSRAGDAKAAMCFYRSALQGAGGAMADPVTVARLRSAREFIDGRTREFIDSLDQALDDVAPEDSVARMRLSHALDMLKGRRDICPQQPSVFYYPYLAQRQFFEREEFDWVEALEARTPAIREELLGLLEDGAGFQPYVEDEPGRPVRDFHGLNNNPEWSALYLWRDGALVEDNAARCPATVEALQSVPLSRIGARTPAVLFSRLEGGTHIPPHTGMLNSRLICHLPVIVPGGCWLRVGNETRQWEEGKLLIFDDSIEHEAKNPTGELRVILLFDIWRPELGADERKGISALFDAIDRFQPLPDA